MTCQPSVTVGVNLSGVTAVVVLADTPDSGILIIVEDVDRLSYNLSSAVVGNILCNAVRKFGNFITGHSQRERCIPCQILSADGRTAQL